MKIAVTSDLHGFLPEIEPCELVLICGDIMPLRMQRNIPQSESWLKGEFAEWINSLHCGLVLMVGGNHDFALANMYRDPLKQRAILEEPTNHTLHMLDNEALSIYDDNGKQYTVWGTPYCKIFGNWAYMYEPETLIEAYTTMPENCDIVISHDAPRLCGLGKIYQSVDQFDAGNPWLAEEMLRKHPKYTFCGHIHSGEHKLCILGDMKMVNVSLVNERYKEFYKPFYLNI